MFRWMPQASADFGDMMMKSAEPKKEIIAEAMNRKEEEAKNYGKQ